MKNMKTQAAKVEPGLLIVIVLVAALIVMIVGGVMFDVSPDSSGLPSEYSYDMDQYTQIDPALIQYHSFDVPLPLDAEMSRAIAVDGDGKIYVAADKKIQVYTMPMPIPVEIELAVEPTCLIVKDDGTMLVGAGNTILFLTGAGVETKRFTVPADNAMLTSIAFDDENVFAADAVNKLIWRFGRDGNVVGKIGEKNPDRNIPGIVVPSPYFDMAMDIDGLLRVVNPGRHLIEAYTVDGDREWAWGTTSTGVEGFSGCCNPVALAILPDGSFVTAEKGLVRVKTYDADGRFVNVVAGPEQLEWTGPMRVCNTPAECQTQSFDVAVDAEGRIYVLDLSRNVIRIFEKNEQ